MPVSLSNLYRESSSGWAGHVLSVLCITEPNLSNFLIRDNEERAL